MFDHLTEEERGRMALAFEKICQGLHVAEDGHIEVGMEMIETGLLILKPTPGMRFPSWMKCNNVRENQ